MLHHEAQERQALGKRGGVLSVSHLLQKDRFSQSLD